MAETKLEYPEYTMRLGDFLRQFEGLSPDTEIFFGAGNLEFLRLKSQGKNVFQIEFAQQTLPSGLQEDNKEYQRRTEEAKRNRQKS